jgi:uncharacterized short protein YbdD (DUF466 family)
LRLGRALTAEDFMAIRQELEKHGIETSCGACYVDSRRINMATVINKAMNGFWKKPTNWEIRNNEGDLVFEGNKKQLDKHELFKGFKVYKGQTKVKLLDGYTAEKITKKEWIKPLNVPKEMLLTMKGITEDMPKEHPEEYQRFRKLFGGTQIKIPEARTEYKQEIRKFSKSLVDGMNKASGMRWQSWSDFEPPHLLDGMQAIFDMNTKGLKGHAYTKVPEFVEAFARTGMMINQSLIPKGNGLDKNGELVWDERQSFPPELAFANRLKYDNVGTVAIGVSDAHIMKLMMDERIDFILPFHASGLSGAFQKVLGMSDWKNYEAYQEDKNPNDFQMIKGEKIYKNADESTYWSEHNGDPVKFDAIHKEKGTLPRFYNMRDWAGWKGYEKLLTDRRIYDRNGKPQEQKVVVPEFDMVAINRILKSYQSPEYLPHEPTVQKFAGISKTETPKLETDYSVRKPVDPSDGENAYNRATHESAWKAGADEKLLWQTTQTWRGPDGKTHVGEPSGEIGKIRAEYTEHDRKTESPAETARKFLGIQTDYIRETDNIPSPALASLKADGTVDPALMADVAMRFASAYTAEWSARADVEKLRMSGLALDRGTITTNQKQTSLYVDVVDPAGERYRLRISDHAPSKGTDKFHPYDVDLRIPDGATVHDADAIASAIQKDFFHKIISVRGERNAGAIVRALNENGVSDVKDSLINKVSDFFGYDKTDPKRPLRYLRDLGKVWQMPPQHLMRVMENGNFDVLKEGPISSIWHGAHQATTNQFKIYFEAYDRFNEAMKRLDKNQKKLWNTKKVKLKTKYDLTYRDGSRSSIKLNQGEMVALYLAGKDSDNLRHMVNGGVIFERQKTTGDPIVLTKEFFVKLSQDVEKDNNLKFIADEIHGVLQYMGAHINNASRVTLGKDLAVRDEYFPVIVAESRTNFDWSMVENPQGMKSLERAMDILSGVKNLQARTQGASGSVIIQDPVKLINRYVTATSRYAGWAEYIANAKATIHSSIFKDGVGRKFSDPLNKELKDFIKQMEHGGKDPLPATGQTAWNKFSNWFVDQMVKARLKFNLGVAGMQVVSYNMAQPFMPYKYWAKNFLAKPTSREVMGKYNPQLRARYEADMTMAGEFSQSRYSGRRSVGFAGITFGDWLAVGRIWSGCRDWVKAENPRWSDDMIQTEAGRRTALIVSMSQPSQLPADRPHLARTHSAFQRGMLAIFSSQRNQNFGIQKMHEKEIFQKAKNGTYLRKPQEIVKDSNTLFTTRIVPWMMIALITTFRSKITEAFLKSMNIYYNEDEEGFEEELAWNFAYTMLNDRGMVVSRLVSLARGFKGDHPMFAPIESARELLEIMGEIKENADGDGYYKTDSKYGLAGEDKNSHVIPRAIFALLRLADNFAGTGLPNLGKDAGGIYFLFEEDEPIAHELYKEKAELRRMMEE